MGFVGRLSPVDGLGYQGGAPPTDGLCRFHSVRPSHPSLYIHTMDRVLQRSSEDLFAASTMSFGEHLEELRKSVAKALIWLAVGMMGGLYFADQVVKYIQRPMEEAVSEFYANRSLNTLGLATENSSPTVKQIREFLLANKLVIRPVYEIPELVTLSPPLMGNRAAAASAAASDPTASDPTTTETVTSQTVTSETVTSEASESNEVLVERLLRDVNLQALKPKILAWKNERELTTTRSEEAFMVWMKAGLVIGAVLASPMIFYHLWQFVAAGLYPHERRYVYLYLPMSIGLFLAGVTLAFFAVLQYVLHFLINFNGKLGVDVMPQLTNYVSLVLMLPLGFGIAFQLPLVMLFLHRIGVFDVSAYVRSSRVSILVICIVSMVLTPSDPYSMILMAVPLVILYFVGILLCKFMPSGKPLGSSGYDPA
jgi:sec-independent protein translocase protein TatC